MQKKILSSVIGLVFLFAMLSMASAYTCYQEQFDSEDDSICNQSTGSYVGGFYGGYAESWHDGGRSEIPSEMTHNYIADSGGNNAYTYVSWRMPDYPLTLGDELSLGITPILTINAYYDWDMIYVDSNLTIPDECILDSGGEIDIEYLFAGSNDGDSLTVSCYDNTNLQWVQLGGYSNGGQPVGFIEEAMNWEMPEYNITSCRTITESGTYQVMNDLIDPSTGMPDGFCLWIDADNVNIEGNGYTVDLRGVTDQSDVAIGTTSRNNIYVNNLSVYQEYTMGNVECVYNEYGLNVTFNNMNLIDCPVLVFNGNGELQLLNTNMYINRTSSVFFYSNGYVLTGTEVAFKNITIAMLGENNVQAFVPYMNLTDANDVSVDAFSLETNSFYLDSITYPFLDVPMTVTFMNLPNANYYVFKDGIAISSWLYDSNTETLTFDTEGMGNYTYEIIPIVEESEQSNFIQGSGQTYEVLASSGAGLGKFMGYMSSTLGVFLIGVGIVAIVILVAMSMVMGIKSLISKIK